MTICQSAGEQTNGWVNRSQCYTDTNRFAGDNRMLDDNAKKNLSDYQLRWEQDILDPTLNKHPERKSEFVTQSSNPIKRLYTPLDTADIEYERDWRIRAIIRILAGFMPQAIAVNRGQCGFLRALALLKKLTLVTSI